MQAGPSHRGGCSSPPPLPPEELAPPDALAAPPPTATAAVDEQSLTRRGSLPWASGQLDLHSWWHGIIDGTCMQLCISEREHAGRFVVDQFKAYRSCQRSMSRRCRLTMRRSQRRPGPRQQLRQQQAGIMRYLLRSCSKSAWVTSKQSTRCSPSEHGFLVRTQNQARLLLVPEVTCQAGNKLMRQ